MWTYGDTVEYAAVEVMIWRNCGDVENTMENTVEMWRHYGVWTWGDTRDRILTGGHENV